MELKDAITSRRSVKIFDHDMQIDDEALYEALKLSTDAPNHGMREPWRIVHVSKERLGDMSRSVSRFAFRNEPEKQQSHFDAVTKLGGLLVMIVKRDPRQKENLENHLAFGTYAQNLMLLLYEAGIGTCWKSPEYIFSPKVRKVLGVQDDEDLVGFLYLTDLEGKIPPKKPRHTENFISEY
ncbi:putative nitroreductase [Staphylococcus piscifermentans]|uniref:Nitroreductase n=2 Tax=Staphylococcus TaxID=1279 RepID=A0A239UC18_9STAP|nr:MULTISPECIES: nitroreductase [Staphylococcus]AYU54623.1 nitroreductase [Staphylococcus debuckii]RTX85033.1 nitroreductase [Staphylococcus piscifermentans]GEP83993.1 nitroreductase [Staphylococcus piscifermentans]SNV07435.1 putative nitroreductase [Staphylococcus piscifermentans]